MVLSNSASAQRADENGVTSAEDAFGTKVGNDNVGLYESRNARGFDPQQAGNMRIEGLYFDQPATFGSRLTRSTTMRIGLSAQSYPFPAPTGIADIHLILPANKTIVSASAEIQAPVGQRGITAEVSTPLIADKLGMVLSSKADTRRSDWRGEAQVLIGAGLFRWTPKDSVEIIPFIYYNQSFGEEVQPYVLTGGAFLPPRVDRSVFFGQDWAERRSNDFDAGVIMRSTPWTNWRLQAGLFRSVQDRPHNYVVFLRNTQADGTANLDILAYPKHASGSTSGEVRASGVFTSGSYRQTVHIALRGRDTTRLFGGGTTVNFGPSRIGIYRAVTEPAYILGTRDKDVVSQFTPGVSYVGEWSNVGEFSVGLQKSFYHRGFGREGATPVTTRSQPWLYNATLALHFSADLTAYAGYTRGLEEFGTAPENAVNGGEPVPAGLTKQLDAGFRYRIFPGLNLMAGVFEVSKPYFDRDTANIYTDVGNLRHRGIEMSLAGRPIKGVTVVAGAMILQARVSGLPVDQGLIGDVPPGTPPTITRLNVQYEIPAWHGLSVDAQVETSGSVYANRLDTLRAPATATLALGARYAFTALQAKANLRVQVQNITNAYDWNVEGASGRFSASSPRRYLVRLAADF